MGLFSHFLERRLDRDGKAEALEESAGLFAPPEAEVDAPGRREGGFFRPEDLLQHALSQKVLDGWLQNRHQILVPLTFRLDRLEPAHLDVLMQFAAAVLLNATANDGAALAAAERWLRDVKAGDAALAAFARARSAPQPLSALVAAVRERDLEPYAYACAVGIANTRTAEGHLFANYVAARLALPADSIRSIDRRYRR